MVEDPTHEGTPEPGPEEAPDRPSDQPSEQPSEQPSPAQPEAQPPADDTRPGIPEWALTRTVGEMLAAERRRQGKSISEIADVTRVRGRLMQALEEGDYDKLPSPAYVKGYIQSYVSALGMSPEPFLEAYKAEPHPEAELPVDRVALGQGLVPQRHTVHDIPRGLLVAVGVAIGIVILIWIGSRLVGREPETQPLPVETSEVTETVAAQEETEAVPGVTDVESLEATGITGMDAGAFSVEVVVSDDDSSWLRVTVDGEKVYEGILGEGSTRTWDATDLVTIRVGRPTAVTITRDGEPVEIPRPGEGDLPTVEIAATENE